MRPRSAVCAALLAVVLAAPACGRKTDPLTPDSPRPAAVADLAATVRDDVVYLSWTIPTQNVEGKGLPAGDIRLFRIERADVEHGRKRPHYKTIAELSLDNPQHADVRNGTVVWSDDTVRYGKIYAYRVRAYGARGGVSAYSAEAKASPVPSLSAPKAFAATAGDGVVTLGWEAVTTLSDGGKYTGFIGYNVYRGTGAGRENDAPLNKQPETENAYRDAGVENGKTYWYRVRSVDNPGKPWRESRDSAEVSATPRDTTPPAPPAGLTVVAGVERAFLTWNENREPDLAGYRVYRSLKSGRDYEKLTDKAVNRTTFSDENVRPGTVYYYIVTAVDKSGNESLPSAEQKAATATLR